MATVGTGPENDRGLQTFDTEHTGQTAPVAAPPAHPHSGMPALAAGMRKMRHLLASDVSLLSLVTLAAITLVLTLVSVWLMREPLMPAAQEDVSASQAAPAPRAPSSYPAFAPIPPPGFDIAPAAAKPEPAPPVETAADSEARRPPVESGAQSLAQRRLQEAIARIAAATPPSPAVETPMPAAPLRAGVAEVQPAIADGSPAVPEVSPPPADASLAPTVAAAANTGATPPAANVPAANPAEDAILDVLGRYRSAFSALDAAAVRSVWPSVNHRNLEKSFRQLQEQDVAFFSCRLDVKGDLADALCVGTTMFVPKVGSRGLQTGPSQWNFSLGKGGNGGWQIRDVQAQ